MVGDDCWSASEISYFIPTLDEILLTLIEKNDVKRNSFKNLQLGSFQVFSASSK